MVVFIPASSRGLTQVWICELPTRHTLAILFKRASRAFCLLRLRSCYGIHRITPMVHGQKWLNLPDRTLLSVITVEFGWIYFCCRRDSTAASETASRALSCFAAVHRQTAAICIAQLLFIFFFFKKICFRQFLLLNCCLQHPHQTLQHKFRAAQIFLSVGSFTHCYAVICVNVRGSKAVGIKRIWSDSFS